MKTNVRLFAVVSAVIICLLLIFVASGGLNLNLSPNDENNGTADTNSTTPNQSGTGSQTNTINQTSTNSTNTDSSGNQSSTSNQSSNSEQTTNNETSSTNSSGTQFAEHVKDHEDSQDYVWNVSEIVNIELHGNSIAVVPTGNATVEGSKITVTSAGTYRISGSLNDGQIIVNSNKTVRLILAGANISCSSSSPIYVDNAKKVIIVLEENTQNYVKDGVSYVFETLGQTEPNAAIFSRADLTIFGNGSLYVTGNYNDGIASKDGLIVKSGTITVNSVDDGIRGKDYLIVKDGKITINAGGDGLKSDEAEDPAKGYVVIENGTIDIASKGDCVEAETDITVFSGKANLTAGGGSAGTIYGNASAKGLKADTYLNVTAGTFAINSADDALHSNGNITVDGGFLTISTGDDGFHSDTSLTINGGNINITKSYEGLESGIIIINSGNIHVVSSDDGINVVGGNDASGIIPGPGWMPGPGFPGQDTFTYSTAYYLHINGGYIYVDAMGDGFDINGVVEMSAGTVIINGPVLNDNGALDFGTFKMTGGFLVAVGSSGMSMAPGTSSTQCSILLNFRTQISPNTLINIQDSQGNSILTFTPTKRYQSIAFSSSSMSINSTYSVYTGGSATGALSDGLYRNETYTPGTKYTSFTVSSVYTRIF
jgi:Carbohydrate-binding domain-containing protein Cthe_2159